MSIENNNKNIEKLNSDSKLIPNAINLCTVFIQYDPELLPQVFTKEMLKIVMSHEKNNMKRYFSEYKALENKLKHTSLENRDSVLLVGELEAYLDDIAYVYRLYKVYENAIYEDTKPIKDEDIKMIEQVLAEAGLINIENEDKASSNKTHQKRKEN